MIETWVILCIVNLYFAGVNRENKRYGLAYFSLFASILCLISLINELAK